MSGARVRPTGDGYAGPECSASTDELIDRAVAAINRGDRVTGTALAQQVLAADGLNTEAEDLLAAPADPGEIRRLTILFVDLVDSTVLSTRVEPETYRMLVGRYREQVCSTVHRFEGHIGARQGDGLLAVFGHPTAHEDDARRAVLAGLEITRGLARLNEQAQRRFGVDISARVGVHRGLAYLDTAHDDVYGLAANVAARVSSLSPPGSVVVSEAVAALIRKSFDLEARPPAAVKGVDDLIVHHLVVGERVEPARITRGPLVGRDRELSHLQKCWARAQAGTLRTPGVVFRGEAGIGKSRLAAAAAELAETSGAVVLELVGSPLHPDAGLHPVCTLLERRCGIGRTTEQGKRLQLLQAEVAAQSLDAVSMVPLLAPVLGIDAEAGYEPAPVEGRQLYELIAGAVQTYLLACVGSGAGLLIAEDVHWFDPSTIEILGTLLEASAGRLLGVATGRSGGWLPAGWPVAVFDLTPLTDTQTDALIAALNPDLSAEERAVVARRCDGVPFYIEQVVGGLAEAGVPEALYEPLFARLRARAHAVPVLEAAAVIGRQLDRGLLCAVVDLSDDEIDRVIDELEDALVLEPWGSGIDSWRFRHELLREVAAELAPPSVRTRLHSKVADALVGAGGDPDWRLVAGHYEQAGRFDEAAAAYQQASAMARRRGALAEAYAYLTQALVQLERATPGRERDRREMAARLERGFLTMAGQGQHNYESAADFERCLQLGGGDLHDDELFATLNALTGYYAARADLNRLAEVLESLRAGLKGRQWFRPAIDVETGVLAWLRGEFDFARSYFEEATAEVAAAEREQIAAMWFVPSDPIATAHLHLAWTRMVGGDIDGAEATLAQATCRAEELGFPQGPYMQAYAYFMESWIRIETGQLDRAAVLVADMLSQAEGPGFDMWRLAATTQHAAVSALSALGADDDPSGLSAHITTLTTLLDHWHATGLYAYLTFFDSVLGRLLLAAGQVEQARARLDTGLLLAQDTGMHFYDAELLRLRAHTDSDPDERHAGIAAAHDLARRKGATLFELRAALDDFELRGTPARAALDDAAGRMPVDSPLPELARAQGDAARLADELGDACRRYATSVVPRRNRARLQWRTTGLGPSNASDDCVAGLEPIRQSLFRHDVAGGTIMSNARFVGRVGALAVALGVGIALVNTPATAFAEPGNSGVDPRPDRIALIMGGTTVPTPDNALIEVIKNQYVVPTHPGQDIEYVAVTTPQQAGPITGLIRLLGIALGPPNIWGPGGPGWWPNEPLWKLSGLFDPTLEQSVQAGVADLEMAMAEHGNDQLVIYGVSQGSMIATREMRKLDERYPAGTDAPDIDFVLQATQNLPNGGLLARFPGLYLPIFDWVFDGPAPTDTQFDTVVINRQYDGMADFPLYPLNLVADLNALLGAAVYVHPYSWDVSLTPDPTKTSPAYQGTHGRTSYYLFETEDLPLFGPLRSLGIPEPVIDVFEPFFRVIVELGYDRNIKPWEPTPARLIPEHDPATVVADLVGAIGEGINNAATLLGLPAPQRIPAPVNADGDAGAGQVDSTPGATPAEVSREVGDGVSEVPTALGSAPSEPPVVTHDDPEPSQRKVGRELAATRDQIVETSDAVKETQDAVKPVIAAGGPTVTSAGSDNNPEADTAKPARKAPGRDAAKDAKNDTDGAGAKVSHSTKKALRGDKEDDRGAGARAERTN